LPNGVGTARPPGHSREIPVRLGRLDPAGGDGQPALALHRLDPFGHGRRDAMTVDVPPRPQVADEAAALVERRRAPQKLRHAAQLVDRLAPADFPGATADETQQGDAIVGEFG